MSWNTKRDGYYSRPVSNNLGSPVAKLEPSPRHTHAVIVPGTSYKCFINAEKQETANLLKALARTTVKGTGKRRVKVQPVLLTIAEFHALTTEVKAA